MLSRTHRLKDSDAITTRILQGKIADGLALACDAIDELLY
jgi:hypothetical protein